MSEKKRKPSVAPTPLAQAAQAQPAPPAASGASQQKAPQAPAPQQKAPPTPSQRAAPKAAAPAQKPAPAQPKAPQTPAHARQTARGPKPAKMSILDYIRDKDQTLAEIIQQLCLEVRFGPNITFLFPDSEYREKIAELASDEKTEADAIKIIDSLILPDVVRTGTDFKKKKVGNLLGVELEIASASANRVTLKTEGGASGVVIEADADFQPTESAAVWQVKSGQMPLSGKEFKRQPQPERKSAPARGAKNVDGVRARARLAQDVESQYVGDGGSKGEDPYLGKIVGLLNFLQVNHAELLTKIRPLLDYSPIVSFYLILEPYKTRGDDWLIPHRVLFGSSESWNGSEAYQSAVTEYKSFFSVESKATQATQAPLCLSDWRATVLQIEDARQSITESRPTKKDIVAKIRAAYDELMTSNTIQGKGPILPPETLTVGAAKKLWQDEMRMLIHSRLSEIALEAKINPGVLASEFAKKIVSFVRDDRPGNDYEAEFGPPLAGNVAPTADFYSYIKFISSTDFLYVAVPEGAVGNRTGGDPENPTDRKVFNRNRAELTTLGKVTMDRQSGLSSQALTELQVLLKNGGTLPPELRALLS